jgi:hypothetical protein
VRYCAYIDSRAQTGEGDYIRRYNQEGKGDRRTVRLYSVLARGW